MVFTCKCFGQIDYSSCGSEGLQLSGIAETADAVKGGEHMKAIYRRKGVICVWFLHIFVCSTVQWCWFCTVYNKWVSPSMGYLEGKKEHLEAIFWQSDYSVWAVKIQITALFYQIATATFCIYYAPDIFFL